MILNNFHRRRAITVTQGSIVHHPHHGIGKVKSIRKRSFAGAGNARFAKLFFERDSITLILRESDLAEVVRAPLGADEAQALLDHMRSWKGRISDQWKKRAITHQQKLDAGDAFGCAEVFKCLRRRQCADRMSAADRSHLKQSTDCLAEELANALGTSRDKALAQMHKATGT